MSRLTPDLARRIRDEIALIDNEAGEAVHAWTRANLNNEDSDYLVKAVALSLHTTYSGIERVFELVARHLDGEVPTGPAWHRDLLYQMAAAHGDDRPLLISPEDADRLAGFLGFRHVVRNIYTHILQPGRIGELVDELPAVWDSVRQQLEAWLGRMTEQIG